jgi:hypothetical protein
MRSDEDLERMLREAAPFVAYPELPDLSTAIGSRLRDVHEPVQRAPRRRLLRPVFRPAFQPVLARAAVVVAIAVALLGATLAISPGARHAVAGWLGLRGVKVEVVPSLSAPPSPAALGTGLNLGKRVTLAQAQAMVPFPIGVPESLGPPDEVYLRTGFIQDQVTLLYRARPGLPEAATTGAGLLLTEFQASIDTELVEKKVAAQATRIDPVTVDGGSGYWIEGAHEIYLIGPDGQPIADSLRLAGNVLLWERGPVTLRMEADISEQEALAIAESVQ